MDEEEETKDWWEWVKQTIACAITSGNLVSMTMPLGIDDHDHDQSTTMRGHEFEFVERMHRIAGSLN